MVAAHKLTVFIDHGQNNQVIFIHYLATFRMSLRTDRYNIRIVNVAYKHIRGGKQHSLERNHCL